MKDDFHNYLRTSMFRGTPCRFFVIAEEKPLLAGTCSQYGYRILSKYIQRFLSIRRKFDLKLERFKISREKRKSRANKSNNR